MTDIPKSHPRYLSLKMRESLVKGVEDGITSMAGLIAHGRGEMFDYLIGEETISTAERAEKKAVEEIIEAKNPVISVNGNVAALVPKEIVELGKTLDTKLEVNLFHRIPERVSKIKGALENNGAEEVFGLEPEEKIPGLDHKRALCSHEGIYTSDVVLVPLEDGDRAEALKKMGKKVITIDLNPLSRTSRVADITIVDNIVRAVPNMMEFEPLYDDFDNDENLKKTLLFMSERLKNLSEEI
ncbi:MAG: phosphopantothenate/pantothenate synthetase [Candidatus Thermoplasmatota archaeon]|nr:phosphopantothenate/pantothenate synthetase [Candidatus Thermoplasmatota archaeon]MBS3789354.1 phosphopantothenate/pantothenate synthetase [Candidatus Thermoplasmatota archaeon]